MKTKTSSEFRQHVSTYLQKVEHGEKFIITRHNQPIAEIRPISDKKQSALQKNTPWLLAIKDVSLSKSIIHER